MDKRTTVRYVPIWKTRVGLIGRGFTLGSPDEVRKYFEKRNNKKDIWQGVTVVTVKTISLDNLV